MHKHTTNDSNKIIELNTTGNKEWMFSTKAKTEYPALRHVVKEANNAAEINDTCLLRATLTGAADLLEGRGGKGNRRDLDSDLSRVIGQVIEAEIQRFIRGLFLHGNGKTTLKEAVAMTHGK